MSQLQKVGDTMVKPRIFLVPRKDVDTGKSIYTGKPIGLRASNGISSVSAEDGSFAELKPGQAVTLCCRPIQRKTDSDEDVVRFHCNMSIKMVKEVDCACKECGWTFLIEKHPPKCECDPTDTWIEEEERCVIM